MSDLEAYFAETMPDDERLTNYRAFARGAAAGLEFFIARIKGYCDLLDVELEGNPTAQAYLQDNLAALARANRVLDGLQALLKPSVEEFEALDLLLLMQGVTTRLNRIGRAELVLHETADELSEAFVRGRLFLIQQALFEIPHFFTATDGLKLNVWLERRDFDDAYFRKRRSDLPAGEYYAINMAPAAEPPAVDELVCFTEKLVVDAGLQLDDPLLFVYGIVLDHGGEILTTTVGESLTILLPGIHNQVEMYGEKGLEEEDLKGTETILLVDDEGIIWDVVIDMLQGLGYTVILAENGRDCVEIYRENPGQIDLVLLDMVMPEMNGHDAFFALKEIDADVKVLLQSGYMAQEEAQDVLDAGALGFLQKPYRMAELAQRIRGILG